EVAAILQAVGAIVIARWREVAAAHARPAIAFPGIPAVALDPSFLEKRADVDAVSLRLRLNGEVVEDLLLRLVVGRLDAPICFELHVVDVARADIEVSVFGAETQRGARPEVECLGLPVFKGLSRCEGGEQQHASGDALEHGGPPECGDGGWTQANLGR